MTVRDDFYFIAGATALDLLNTEAVREGERVDLLDSPEDLDDWLVAAGLASARETKERPCSEKLLREVLALRGELRTTADRLAGGGKLRKSDIDGLNLMLGKTRGRLTVAIENDQARIGFAPDHPDAVFLVARAIADFLAVVEPRYVRRCEGTGCILFFYDTTKSHTRRWCSMSGCGNRMKASLFYRRKSGKS